MYVVPEYLGYLSGIASDIINRRRMEGYFSTAPSAEYGCFMSLLQSVYSMVQKCVFQPTWATHGPYKYAIWHGEQTTKLLQLGILIRNLYLSDDLFAQFARNCQRLYSSIGSF